MTSDDDFLEILEAYDIFQDTSVDPKTKATLVTDPKKRTNSKRGNKFVELHPNLPDDTKKETTKNSNESLIQQGIVNSSLAEDRVRAGGMPRIDYLIRLGLGDTKKLYYYRNAILDPEAAVRNPTLRPYVGEVLERTLDLIFNDAQLYNRFRALLQKQDRPRGEDTLPEQTERPAGHRNIGKLILSALRKE